MKTWIASNGQLLEIDKICSVISIAKINGEIKYGVTFKTGGGITVFGIGLMTAFTKTARKYR